jgi:hypothetical protein
MDLNHILQIKQNLKGVVVDTNLLLLLLIGSFDKRQIGREKRINKYELQDFEKLNILLKHFPSTLFITQSILSEVTNLSSNYNEETGFSFFRYIETQLLKFKETEFNSLNLVSSNQKAFYKFGLTDVSIIDLAKNNCLIVTDDLPMYHYLQSQNFYAINYNHLRFL